MGNWRKYEKVELCVDLFDGCRWWKTTGSNCQLQADQQTKCLIISKAALIEFDSETSNDRNEIRRIFQYHSHH